MKILTVVGARPQFIKAAAVSRELRREHNEVLVHTGQHYDVNMSRVFFDELEIPRPDYNLNIGSAGHGEQTGRMLIELERVILTEKPDYVLVYGDTNSTLAGALVGSKLLIPVIHVEAGLRSYNKRMPEEQNRVLTDHMSDFLFCPTATAVANLAKEDIVKGVYNSGDVMYDSVFYNMKLAMEKSDVLERLELKPEGYYLATVHRAENTDDPNKLLTILEALNRLDQKVVFPMHPRTRNILKNYGRDIETYRNILVVEPVGYLDMLMLTKHSRKVLTDSGGLQKEAYFLDRPCVTLRNETEWVETLDGNWNVLVDVDNDRIVEVVKSQAPEVNIKNKMYFGNGRAAEEMLRILKKL